MIEQSDQHQIQISVEAVRNIIYSFQLIQKSNRLSGINHWPIDVYNDMSDKEKEIHRLLFDGFFYIIMPEETWNSFPEYLNFLESRDPLYYSERLIDQYIIRGDLKPTNYNSDNILCSRDSYITFLKEVLKSSNKHFYIDNELESRAYELLKQPEELKSVIVGHLTMLWTKYMAVEWTKVVQASIDSVNAFQSINFTPMSIEAAFKTITDKECQNVFKNHTLEKIPHLNRFVFVPSPHVGPYLNKFIDGDTMWIFFGARLPENSNFNAPLLDHHEIITKLTALSDRTRLQILKHISQVGARTSSQIISDLNLSQSAASRHLKQLSATGFLDEKRVQSGKSYNINNRRVRTTLESVTNYLITDS